MSGDRREDQIRHVAAESALLLVQFAACRAEIGQFARRGLQSPRVAARCYEVAATAAARPPTGAS